MFRRLLPLLALALALLSPVPSSAKTGPEHCRDMLDVLGLTSDKAATPAYQNANEAAKEITKQIDTNFSPLRASIQEIAPAFNLGESIHRLFFHWGFNENPRHGAALAEQINKATNSEADRERIWGLVIAEQKRRNGTMMARTATEFGKNSPLMLSRAEQNALTSIMYNAHILGDYEVSAPAQTGGMVSLDAIIADTLRSVRTRLREPNMELVREFEQQLNTARGMPGTQKKAQTILEMMKIYIPKILNDNRRMRRIVYGLSS